MRFALVLLLLATAGCVADPVASVQAPGVSAAYMAHESTRTTHTVTEEEFRRAARHDLSMEVAVSYMGRKDGFDYFYTWYIESETYRVPAPNGIVKSPMAFTSDRKLWVDCRTRTGNGWLP